VNSVPCGGSTNVETTGVVQSKAVVVAAVDRLSAEESFGSRKLSISRVIITEEILQP